MGYSILLLGSRLVSKQRILINDAGVCRHARRNTEHGERVMAVKVNANGPRQRNGRGLSNVLECTLS